MPPFQRPLLSGTYPHTAQRALGSETSRSDYGFQPDSRISSPDATLETKSIFTPPPTTASTDDDDESPRVQLHTRTYASKGVQTSAQPDAVPYPHAYSYPISYGYNQNIYWPTVPWNALNTPFFPSPQTYAAMGTRLYHASEQTWFQSRPTGVIFIPTGHYTDHTVRYPYPRPIHQRSFSGQPPRDTSPLIAPPPKVPLPSPDTLSFASSEPLSPPTQLPFTTTSSTGYSSALFTRRALSTPPPHSSASPVENPFNTLYKSLRSVLLISEPDPKFLAREISGEQLVSVHGVGVWSVRSTSPATVERAKQHAFQAHASHATWLRAARARTAHYAKPGAVRPPLRWVLVERGAALPPDALQTGTEAGGAFLFSARAWWAGGLHVGKAGTHLQKGGASVSYGSLEHGLTTYEVLVGDKSYATWIDVPADALLAFLPENPHTSPVGALDPNTTVSHTPVSTPDALPASFTPVEGGREEGGEALLIAQAPHAGGWHPGKARLGDDHCCVAYGGGEVWVKRFRVLGYNI